ncbi:hypothetical protein ACIQNG_31065 [Streptomyces sp. NPDC091377]|uniref:hypothetical protein n=1 Tax=unclassified Streptomyces TaxID=2593676 RepID=UPI0037F85EAC
MTGVLLAVGVTTACDPSATISTTTIAYTTDELLTREMERRDIDVQWLSCNAGFGDRGTPSASASERNVAELDCEGQTKDTKDIEVRGKVTRAVDGACVRGELTVKVDGKERFRVTALGDCDATSAPPVDRPSGGADPTTTVTVTKTVYCQDRPQCWPEGK